ncbi:MAG: hypothetical protein KAH93_02735 [Candidatus Aenigmarchaeota archaeon]|nr:hypothetical protein [Candidatus Aenigmarchaeota archaeon]
MDRVLVVMMFLAVIVVLSGCTGQDVSVVDNSTDISVDVDDATGNVSDDGRNVSGSVDNGFSVIIELKEPPKEVIGG